MGNADAFRPGRAKTRTAAAIAGLAIVLIAGTGAARADPPITSPEDAACREVARSKVFSVPDPLNLGLREIGRQIYMACLQRLQKRQTPRKHQRRRR